MAARSSRRLLRTGASLLIAVFAAVAVVACADPTPADERDAMVYDAVVQWLLDNEIDPSADGPTALFVEFLGTETVSLEVEVAMLELAPDDVTIRFIDERSEAIDEDAPSLAVRDGGVLIGFGPLSRAAPVSLRVELYRDADAVMAFRFRLVESGSAWWIEGEPRRVGVEGFDVR